MDKLKIALIGYGKMGHIIKQLAEERGHEIALIIDRDEEELFDDPRFRAVDVAIEFTTPQTAYDNCLRALERGIPVVSGTTGWSDRHAELQARCGELGGTVFWASNFSIGVNLFLQINRRVAALMAGVPEYKLSMQEIHHIHKLDAPSGTAITLAETILSERPDLKGWELGREASQPDSLPIEAIREGEVPGTHSVTYHSSVDEITLTHRAFGREGFALGAIVAAEYARTHKGWLTMSELLHLN